MSKTDDRIADLKAHGYSPDDEGFPNPDVEWLVAELERARAALKAIKSGATFAARKESGVSDAIIIEVCDEGLGE